MREVDLGKEIQPLNRAILQLRREDLRILIHPDLPYVEAVGTCTCIITDTGCTGSTG